MERLVNFAVIGARPVQARRALGSDKDAQSVLSWEVICGTVAHLTAVVESISVALDSDVTSCGVSCARSAGCNHDNRAWVCVEWAIAFRALDVLHSKSLSVAVLVEIVGEVVSFSPVCGWDRVIEATLSDSTVASSVDIVGNMGVASTIWVLSNRVRLCLLLEIVHVRLADLCSGQRVGIIWANLGKSDTDKASDCGLDSHIKY